MSDLRPIGAPVVIGGQEYNILFTIGAIEAIQETCNKALVETMPAIACAQKSPAQYKLATWYLQDTAFSKR